MSNIVYTTKAKEVDAKIKHAHTEKENGVSIVIERIPEHDVFIHTNKLPLVKECKVNINVNDVIHLETKQFHYITLQCISVRNDEIIFMPQGKLMCTVYNNDKKIKDTNAALHLTHYSVLKFYSPARDVESYWILRLK